MIYRTRKEHMLTVANKTLSNRNKILEKRVHALEKELIIKEVASSIDKWLDEPYEEHESEQKDIKNFARKITNYMFCKIRT